MFTLLLHTLKQQRQHSLRKQESAFNLTFPSRLKLFRRQLQKWFSDKPATRIEDSSRNRTTGEQFRGYLLECAGHSGRV